MQLMGIYKELEDFFRKVAPGTLTLTEKLRIGTSLLSRAENIYQRSSPHNKEFLSPLIRKLRTYLAKVSAQLTPSSYTSLRQKALIDAETWLKEDFAILPTDRAISITRRLLERLRQVAKYPNDREKKVISKLEGLLARLRKRKFTQITIQPKPTTVSEEEVTPPIILEAENFKKAMEATPPTTEKALRDASYRALTLVGELRKYLTSLDINEYKRWAPVVKDEITSLSFLRNKFLRQLDAIRREEEKKRSYSFMVAKREYEKKSYLEAVRKAEEEGKINKVADEAAASFDTQITRIIASANAIMEKAEREKLPDALPVDKLRSIVDRAEKILAGIISKVPVPKANALKKKFDLLRFTLVRMENLKNKLLGTAV